MGRAGEGWYDLGLYHCHMCKRRQGAEYFYKDRTRSSGLSSRCIQCEHKRSAHRAGRQFTPKDKDYARPSAPLRGFGGGTTIVHIPKKYARIDPDDRYTARQKGERRGRNEPDE